jgi:hypothetical protein
MGIAIAGLVLTALALLVSLGFNYLQYTWRNEERAQHAQDKAEAKAEQERKERTPPEFFNTGGTPYPIAITGSQHSVQGPFMDCLGSSLLLPTMLRRSLLSRGLDLRWNANLVTAHSAPSGTRRCKAIFM